MCWETLQAFSQPWSYAGCWDRALCQQTLQPCCLEKTVLPRYCCWIYAVRNLGWLNCFLACQECPLLVYKSVVGGESELSFSQIFMAAVLCSLSCLSTKTLFSILFCSAIRLRALASDTAEERKDWNFFSSCASQSSSLEYTCSMSGGHGGSAGRAVMGAGRHTLGTASVIAGLPLGEEIAAAIPTGANLLLLLLSSMFIRLQLQTSFVQEVIWTFLTASYPLLSTEKGTMSVCLSGQGKLFCSIGNLAWEEENLRYQN